MATLAIAKTFLADFAQLQKPVQKKVQDLFTKFAEDSTAPALNLEAVHNAADPRARTVRVDQAYRGVVAAPERGDTYILVSVLHHDDAYRWVESKQFSVNQLTGALEIYDLTELEAATAAPADAEEEAGGLFDEVADKSLQQLGIPADLIPLVRRLDSDEELDAFTTLLPRDQGDVLAMLAAGYTPEEAYAELVAGEKPEPIDPGDLAAAVRREASAGDFYVAEGGAPDLVEQLNKPLSLWRVFLHPTQRRIAYRDSYRGPVRVTGGAGTGKTVAALHRAKHLAGRDGGDGAPRILFTTFTRNLADTLQGQLHELGGPALTDRVEVTNVDQLAYRIVREAEGEHPAICTDAAQQDRWEKVVDELGVDFTASFLAHEWTHVVLAQGVDSRDAYFRASRASRGVRLSRRQRAHVWQAVEEFGNHLAQRNERTFLQLADAAAGYLQRESIKPYDHVIVDEAQDLHPAQWRMVRAIVEPGPDDLFIVGDTHQRIYDNRVSLSALGIEIRGRSHRLRLNYRTTQEILRWSLALLRGETFDDLDDGSETLVGYRSELRGPWPETAGYRTTKAELDSLVEAVRAWGEDGVAYDEIGVAARTNGTADAVVRALDDGGIDAVMIDPHRSQAAPKAVNVGTMHRMKGIEHRRVAVVDVGEGRVPLPWAVTPEAEDPVQHAHDVQRERCLLYVACTRGREHLRVSWSGKPSALLQTTTSNAAPDG